MNISESLTPAAEAATITDVSYLALRELSATCFLTKADRRILADLLQRADKIGTGAYVMLARLLSQKLLYAPLLEDGRAVPTIAASGSQVTYAIDGLQPRSARLCFDDGYAFGQGGIHLETLLGATLIGMSAGAQAPFLQADGSFRTVHLLDVENTPPQR